MSWCRYQDESRNVQSVKLHLEGETGVAGGTELLGQLHAELGTLRLGGVAVRKAIGRLAHKMKKGWPLPEKDVDDYIETKYICMGGLYD